MKWARERDFVVGMSLDDVALAALVGATRQRQNVEKGRKDRYGFKGDGEAAHVLGAMGEMAVAWALREHWEHYRFGAADVGDDVEVRTVTKPDRSLILHEADKDDRRYHLCVVGEKAGKHFVKIVGWTYGKDGKQPDYWGDKAHTGRPAFFVPQRVLLPIARMPHWEGEDQDAGLDAEPARADGPVVERLDQQPLNDWTPG